MKRNSIRWAKVPNLRQAGKVILTLAVLLLLTSVTLAANGYEISREVIGSGGGHSEAGPYSLDATIGQAVVGASSSGDYELGAGFWNGTAAQYKIYLPVVLKNYS